ncbi:hypothetical protein [uncultured Psychroserpens sp.]|uniref:hypothetical protein n=1 Tax=uncultured Psychroserpens sp. TaxID=255436 RepID=UPI0026343C0B|nr:hypothetical protein [uncultured Psychroserpens sp.]
MKALKLIFTLLVVTFSINCSTPKQGNITQIDYKLESIEYNIEDSSIKNLVQTNMDKTKFKKGQSIKESTFIKERKRIAKLIRKNENPNFSTDQVSFEIDTTVSKNKFSVTTTIKQ